MLEIQLVFKYFNSPMWLFNSGMVDTVISQMNQQDRADFPCDVRDIDWDQCMQLFCYGLRRFFIKEDIVGPETHF